MAMTLGGRAAEEIVFGEITTGASNDLEKVTATAKQMVMRFGMCEKLGPRVFGHDHGQPFLGREFSSEPDYSDEIAREIDDEIRRIVEAAHQRAKDILTEHREALELDLRDPRQARDDREGGVRGAARRQDRGGRLRPRGDEPPPEVAGPAGARRRARPRGPAPAARAPASPAAPRRCAATGRSARSARDTPRVTREETIRTMFDAANRGDVEGVLTHVDDEIEAIPLRAAVEDVSYRGHSGVRQFLADNAAIWDDFTVEVEEIRPVGEGFVVLGRMVGEGRVSGVKTEVIGAWVVEFRGNRVSYYRTYADRNEAIAEAEQRQA